MQELIPRAADVRANSVMSMLPPLALNDLGLPIGYYRSDMIIPADVVEEISDAVLVGTKPTSVIYDEYEEATREQRELDRQTALQHAFVPLNYDEGFPTLPSGHPYWSQLDHEPIDDYYLLDLFLKLPTLAEGARSLAFLPDVISKHLERSVLLTDLKVLHEQYYWQYRAKAYDLFREAARRKQMELRGLETNNAHFIMAERYLAKLELYFDSDEDFWDLLTPKVAIDMLKQLTQMQRVAVGMPATGPSSNEVESTSFEVHLKSIAHANHDTSSFEQESALALNNVLADADATAMAQELVIKMGAKRRG